MSNRSFDPAVMGSASRQPSERSLYPMPSASPSGQSRLTQQESTRSMLTQQESLRSMLPQESTRSLFVQQHSDRSLVSGWVAWSVYLCVWGAFDTNGVRLLGCASVWVRVCGACLGWRLNDVSLETAGMLCPLPAFTPTPRPPPHPFHTLAHTQSLDPHPLTPLP
jgi:hypothetical protein